MKSKTQMFAGFSPATFTFLKQLAQNNNKPWFEKHREIYEKELLLPMKGLVTALVPAMYGIDPGFDMRPNKIVSRIYRDIRFSKNKSPYKTCMWITFQRMVEDWLSFPGFYLEINAESCVIGMGLFEPKKSVMDRYRLEVEYEKDYFREMTEPLIAEKGFLIMGTDYKRLLKSTLPEYYQAWIQKKNIYLSKTIPLNKEMYSLEFAQSVGSELSFMKPLYDFFLDICDPTP